MAPLVESRQPTGRPGPAEGGRTLVERGHAWNWRRPSRELRRSGVTSRPAAGRRPATPSSPGLHRRPVRRSRWPPRRRGRRVRLLIHRDRVPGPSPIRRRGACRRRRRLPHRPTSPRWTATATAGPSSAASRGRSADGSPGHSPRSKARWGPRTWPSATMFACGRVESGRGQRAGERPASASTTAPGTGTGEAAASGRPDAGERPLPGTAGRRIFRHDGPTRRAGRSRWST